MIAPTQPDGAIVLAEEAIYQNALPLGSMLLEHRLESVLGMGGFGMTYLAWDTNLEKHVAIKEYLPAELAVRALDGCIVPVNTQSEYNYKWGLDRFIQEARTLARFSHPNIVRVNRFFEANGTSYMVMDYEAGESLNQYLKHSPAPGESTLRKIMLPIIDGLEAVHRAGFLHRDIKPSNVFLRENGPPLLIDFGSARLANDAASETVTSIVSAGYAPLEQYMRDGHQGPWTDIYALSAVLYRAVTDANPPDAVSRVKSDKVHEALAAASPRYDERFLRAIEWGLKLEEKLRPQNVAEWRELISGRRPASALNHSAQPGTSSSKLAAANPASPRAARAGTSGRRARWLRRAFYVATALAVVTSLYHQRTAGREKQPAAQDKAAAAESQGAAKQPFETVDADRSGGASREEIAERLPRYANRFDEIDSDKNGVVSPRELEQFLRTQAAADTSGQAGEKPPASTDSETAQAPERTQPIAAAAGVPPAMTKEFVSADLNGDGHLTPPEVRGRFPAIERNFAAADANGDGRLSLDEFRQFRRNFPPLKPGP